MNFIKVHGVHMDFMDFHMCQKMLHLNVLSPFNSTSCKSYSICPFPIYFHG